MSRASSPDPLLPNDHPVSSYSPTRNRLSKLSIGAIALSTVASVIAISTLLHSTWNSGNETGPQSGPDGPFQTSIGDSFPGEIHESDWSSQEDGSVSDTRNRRKRLPDAIIIGVKKAGTRALLEYLRLHPNVRAPGPETHFFDRFYNRGLDWYRKQMPVSEDGTLCIEKTPAYFVRKEVPARVSIMSPDTKLLVVVRDPVTRAISDYTQSFSKGRTSRRFAEMAFTDPGKGVVDLRWSGIRIGLYARHLKKWLPHFPLSQIHFVSGENLISDPVPEMNAVERFLGLSPFINSSQFNFNTTKGFPCVRRKQKPTSSPSTNVTQNTGEVVTDGHRHFKCLGKTKGREHPKVHRRTIARLKAFFKPHNKEFFRMVSRNFGWN